MNVDDLSNGRAVVLKNGPDFFYDFLLVCLGVCSALRLYTRTSKKGCKTGIFKSKVNFLNYILSEKLFLDTI